MVDSNFVWHTRLATFTRNDEKAWGSTIDVHPIVFGGMGLFLVTIFSFLRYSSRQGYCEIGAGKLDHGGAKAVTTHPPDAHLWAQLQHHALYLLLPKKSKSREWRKKGRNSKRAHVCMKLQIDGKCTSDVGHGLTKSRLQKTSKPF